MKDPNDGYTISFFLRGVPGLYPDLRGQRRPMLRESRKAAINDGSRMTTAKAELAFWDKVVKKMLVSWSATDAHTVYGEKQWSMEPPSLDVLPLEPESFAKLEPDLWERLLNVVTGCNPGDNPNEDRSAKEPEGEWESTTDDERQARDEKNSAAG